LLKLIVRKKLIVSITVVVILILGIGINNTFLSNSTIEGEICKSQSQTKSSGGLDFICEKNGAKLIWVDKAKSSRYAVGPTSRLVYRYVDGNQQRLNQYQIWQSQDERLESEFDPIRVAAHKSINLLAVDKNHSNITFEYLVRPSFPTEIAEVIKLQSIEAAKKLSPLFDKAVLIKLILVTEKDKDFIDNELPSIVPKYDWQGALDNISSYQTLESFYTRGGTGGGTASYLPEKKFGYYIGHTSSLATMETYWPEVAPHEMAHIVQGFLANGFASNFPDGHPKAKWSRHLIEGSANTVGMGLGFSQLGWYSDEMDNLLADSIDYGRSENYSTFDKSFPMKDINDAVALIKKLEAVGPGYSVESDLTYSAGQFLWEFYIGSYGFNKYIELLKALDGRSMDEALKTTIGLNKDAFYQAAAPYLLSNWQRLSKIK
jgi:hypothetical protein